MAPKLRAVVVGAGFIGSVHARAVRAAGATLVGVADRNGARAAALAETMGPVTEVLDPDAAFGRDDVQVVHICTPNETHVPLVEAALRAGKHVVCEKPLATKAADALRVAALAEEAGVVAAVPFAYRFYPVVREIRQRIASGEAGRLTLVHGSYLQDWLAGEDRNDWRVDRRVGGASRAFSDIGVHWIDLAEFVTGQRVTRLVAQILTAFPTRTGPDGPVRVDTEDAGTVLFATDDGALGSLVLSQVSLGHKNRIALFVDGASASYAFDHEQPDLLWVGRDAANEVVFRGPDTLGPAAARYSVLPVGHPQGFQDAVNAFVADVYAAVEGAPPDGLPRFADGVRAAQLTEAVLASVATNNWVEVPCPPHP